MMVGRRGIEPLQPKAADLQSAELTTCSTYPRNCQPIPVGPRSAADFFSWSRRRVSNPEPAVYKTAALPIELRRQAHGQAYAKTPGRPGMIWAGPLGGQARTANPPPLAPLAVRRAGRAGWGRGSPASARLVIARWTGAPLLGRVRLRLPTQGTWQQRVTAIGHFRRLTDWFE